MNPYAILGVPPGADSATVARAMAAAMKARRHPPQVLAEAQRVLLSAERRLLADFLLPVLPAPRRLVVPPEPGPPPALPPWPHEDLGALLAATRAAVALDEAAAAAVADAPLPPDTGAMP